MKLASFLGSSYLLGARCIPDEMCSYPCSVWGITSKEPLCLEQLLSLLVYYTQNYALLHVGKVGITKTPQEVQDDRFYFQRSSESLHFYPCSNTSLDCRPIFHYSVGHITIVLPEHQRKTPGMAR